MQKLNGFRLVRALAQPLSLVTFVALSAIAFDTGCGSSDSSGGAAGAAAAAHAGSAGNAAAGKAGVAGAPSTAAGASAGGAGGASAAGSSSGGASTAGSGGTAGVDPALDAACTAQCAKQSMLACVANPCHDKCLQKSAETPSANHDCKAQFKTMVQCTSKLMASQWQCSPDDGAVIPAEGQCTTEVCDWTCCATDIYAPTDLWGRCNANCPE